MKVLKYTEENLEIIAKERGLILSEVQENLEQARRLDMEIYSTIDYIFFNTGVIDTGGQVTFVSSKIIEEYFTVFPAPPGVYHKAVLKK